jgi:hypothetical protein
LRFDFATARIAADHHHTAATPWRFKHSTASSGPRHHILIPNAFF